MIPAYSCYGCHATVPFKYPLFRLGCTYGFSAVSFFFEGTACVYKSVKREQGEQKKVAFRVF